MDLGGVYRLYAVACHGFKYDPTAPQPYYTTGYFIYYGLLSDSLTAYEEGGNIRQFDGNTAANYNDIIKSTFNNPFLAQYVKYEGLSNPATDFPALQMEVYGCQVFPSNAKSSVYNNNGAMPAASPALSDDDMGTSVEVITEKKYILSVRYGAFNLSNVRSNSEKIIHAFLKT